MWKLEVSHNQISSIPSMAFYGLERALWELHLNHNRLIRVPADSITLLKKLAVLNLAGKINPLSVILKRYHRQLDSNLQT
jgi:Leucine-rich repeat (LRR) protein